MEQKKKATIEELNIKVQKGLLKAAAAIGDDPELNETLKYLERTWEYLYSNTLLVGVELYSLDYRTDEEIRDKLRQMHFMILGRVEHFNPE
jgi:hypothetical protein